MKKFEFFDKSYEDCDGWWIEAYTDKHGEYYYSLNSILDHCVSLNDKIALSLLPEHYDWPEANDDIFSEIDDLDIASVAESIKDMGYDITIDGTCIFEYKTQPQGYFKSIDAKYIPAPKIVNKFASDKDFEAKLEELMYLSGVQIKDDAVSEFLDLVQIRNKVREALPLIL